jgi:hypothetical protein
MAVTLGAPPSAHAGDKRCGFEQLAEVWGRPAALAVAKEGTLLIADDTGGTIWRISYKDPPSEHVAAPAKRTGSNVKSQAGGR